MVISPKVKGFICTTAHPTGCRENVKRQIEYVKKNGKIENGPKKVLVIGSSTGYGLASRITSAFSCGAETIGIMFEKEAVKSRTATPGYYNTEAFEEFAKEEGIGAYTINGDAFSMEIKEKTAELIKEKFGKADMIIYSLAAPRRTDKDGNTFKSVLKTVNSTFTNKSWNLKDNTISMASIEPATEEEVEATVKVMGGEDWEDWIDFLKEKDLLTDKCVTVAYSYLGPEFTYPVYREGTIGMAKKHLKETSERLNEKYNDKGISAYISVNKALVTQASAAIPIVPLYFAVLYRIMKEKNIHEGCIEQINRLFRDKLLNGEIKTDEEGYIRMDDLEMRKDVQSEVMESWNIINSDNILEVADIKGYWEDFYHLFGFEFDNVDYNEDVEI